MADLDQLVDEFLRQEFEESPVSASGLGLTEFDDRLDDLSAEAFDRRQSRAAEWSRRFAALTDAGLAPEERIDRDLAVAMMAGRSIMAEWMPWRRDPVTYSGPIANGLFGLFLHRLRPESELVDAAVARLAQAPRALEQGRANLDPKLAHPLILERGRDAARGTARYVREMLPREAGTDRDRARLAEAGADAARALDAWAALSRRHEPHRDRIVAARRGALHAAPARARGAPLRRSLAARPRPGRVRPPLRRDARPLALGLGHRRLERGPGARQRGPSGDRGGDAPDLRGVDGEGPAVPRRNGPGHDSRGRVVRRPAVAAVPAPPRRSGVVQSPPAFAPSLLGHFFVPFAPEGASAAEIQKRLAANSFGHIPTTTVHEAYPGHHWHLVVRKARARRLRRVLGTPYFNEGWGLYAERLMRERGFFTEPIQELNHLKATLFRAARIVVDTSLHLGEMSYEEAVRFMVEKTATPEPTARAEVGRYCWWPTQASAYLTGCLEILRIRDRYLESRGLPAGSAATAPVAVMRDFHDRMAESGSLPLGLAEKALLAQP